jgi:hypothetical protein
MKKKPWHGEEKNQDEKLNFVQEKHKDRAPFKFVKEVKEHGDIS